MFAPSHHSATKYAVGPRKELAVRTIFNMLGPLTNPARVPNLVVGVYSKDLVEPVASVMNVLGNRHVLVVHSHDGMDEISIAAPTSVAELKDGKIEQYEVTPEQFGLERGSNTEITVNSIEDSYAIMQSVLDNQSGPARDIVLLNAGAAIYASNLTPGLDEGIKLAGDSLAGGKAKQKLEELISVSNSFNA
jgi:anthranilate phosphoribosyltransferase